MQSKRSPTPSGVPSQCESTHRVVGHRKSSIQFPLADVPAYCVHRAKDLGYVRLAGRMIYLGRANTSESVEQYRRVIAEWLASGRVPSRGAEQGQGGWTVDQLADGYLRWARAYYLDADGNASSGLSPVEAALKHLRTLYGSTRASDFGPIALRAVRQAMITAGLCRNVVNQRVSCIKRLVRWGVAEERVPVQVLQAIDAVEPLRRGRGGARETPAVMPVPDASVEAVVPFLPATLRAMVRVQRLTGLRSGELCRMRTCDINQSADVWIYRPSAHKTMHHGHERTIYLGPQARAAIAPFIHSDAQDRFLFSPTQAGRERRGAKQRSSCGRGCNDRYNPRSYRRAICYAMDAAIRAGAMTSEQRWHPHRLRHQHATMVRQSKGLDAARILLGHRTLDQTLEYAEADRATAIAVARELA